MASSLLVFLVFLAFSVSPTKSAEILRIHDTNLNNAASMAVSVSNHELEEVSHSILMAETWLRNHVLRYYPSYNITHIVVAHNYLCSHEHFHHQLVLPAVKNLHHSLTRWNLHSEIRVSPTFTSHCFSSSHHLRNNVVKPLLNFLKSTNSSYLINPVHEIDPKFESLVKTHMEFVEKIGYSGFESVNLVKNSDDFTQKPLTMRKLSYVEGTLPPLIGVGPTISPKVGLGPVSSPTESPHPHHSHHYHNLPPCNPWGGGSSTPPPAPPQHQHAPAPGSSVSGEKLWCVAKPSVPVETLQEAMDYACGEADCQEIQPSGSCYNPDTVVAHASYAFNSYWQMNKMNAGSCSFGGTAMIINSDPSFQQCRFTVT